MVEILGRFTVGAERDEMSELYFLVYEFGSLVFLAREATKIIANFENSSFHKVFTFN